MSYFDTSYSYLCKNKKIMAKDLFKRYIWLVDTIYQAHGITFEEINEKSALKRNFSPTYSLHSLSPSRNTVPKYTDESQVM